MQQRAVFLDKDGTLVEDVPYNVDPEQMRLTAGVESLRQLHQAGYLLIVISNQSGVARGYFPKSALVAVEQRSHDLLGSLNISLTDFYYCPHHPEGVISEYAIDCNCRKPEPGLLLQAAQDHNIDLSQSWFIGDILNDVEAGRRAGCQTILLNNGNETEWILTSDRIPHYVVTHLAEATHIIIASPTPNPQPSTPFPMHPDLPSLIQSFSQLHIGVIGEAMLDSYLIGNADRLCAEAPVPVVALHDRQNIPGGAANTVVNLRRLGAQVSFFSVIGADLEGVLLRQTLEQSKVLTEALLTSTSRQTLVKHRVMANAQMLLRFDQGSTDEITTDLEQQLIQCLKEKFASCDAIVLSDYSYGIVTPQVIQAIAQLQAQAPKTIVVDSKQLTHYQAIGVTAVKPNYKEALQLLGLSNLEQTAARAKSETRVDQLLPYEHQLLEITGAKIVAVTLDADGVLVLQRHTLPKSIPAQSKLCSSTTGAGDTFTSALTLALAAGASVSVAAELASWAAAIVVEKAGTAYCSAHELQAQLMANPPPESWCGKELLQPHSTTDHSKLTREVA